VPRATGLDTHLSRYEDAWEAINRLIRQGGSWSGFERNCFYRGSPDGSFANGSAISGLDFLDDGRGLAVWDYDRDGDPDLLLKNRSGPQLRILRNDSASEHARITVRLIGTKSNRDAIGARVSIEAGGRRRVKELRAGSGFLSQNSRELFFGLGDAPRVEKLIVEWPSGDEQAFEKLAPGFAYTIREGAREPKRTAFAKRGAAMKTNPPIAHGEKIEDVDGPRRVWLIDPAPLPRLALTGLDGRPASVRKARGRPFILNLWSPECVVCVKELHAWRKARLSRKAEAEEVPVFALTATPDAAARASLEKLASKFELPVLLADRSELLVLSILIEDIAWWRRDLPLPCTLLIDERGRIARIYEGAVDWNQIEKDVAALPKNGAERFGLALPFRGVYHSSDVLRNNFQLGVSFLEAGLPYRALDAFAQVLAQRPDDVETFYNAGLIFLQLGDLESARESFSQAIRGEPEFVDAIVNLGVVAAREQKLEEAKRHFERVLELRADHVEALMNLGNVEITIGQPREAIESFRRAAKLEKTLSAAHKRLGTAHRMLGDLRSAIRAYEEATRVSPTDPEAWSNLGVILAESGELEKGHQACLRAIEVDPKYASAYVNDGLILGALGRGKASVAAFEKAIEIAPDLAPAYLNLARQHLRLGNAREARAAARRVLEFAPGHPGAVELLRALDGE